MESFESFELVLDGVGDVEFAVLEADALSFDGAASDSVSSSSSLELQAPPVALKEPRPPRRRVPQSQRVKAEKALLQEQIVALQKQLADVMAQHAVINSRRPPSAWRATAKRQLTRRNEAEKENQRLRAKLTRQVQVAKSLQVMMASRGMDFFEMRGPRTSSFYGELDGHLSQVFQQFEQDIRNAYEAIDSVLPDSEADIQVPVRERPESKAMIKSHSLNGLDHQRYVELRHSYVVPFSLDEVKHALPKVARDVLAFQNREIERYVYSENLYAGKFLVNPDDVSTSFGNEEAVTTLARSFIEPDRVVLIWRAFGAARNASITEAVGMSTGWAVFRQLNHVKNHAVVHVCCRNVPLRSEVIPKAAKTLPRLPSTQMLFTTESIVPTVTDLMENLILEEAVRVKTTRV